MLINGILGIKFNSLHNGANYAGSVPLAAKNSDELEFSDLFQRLPAEEQKKLLAHIMTVIKRYQTQSKVPPLDQGQKLTK